MKSMYDCRVEMNIYNMENYSEKPSFYGFLRNDDCPPEMSFGDDDI